MGRKKSTPGNVTAIGRTRFHAYLRQGSVSPSIFDEKWTTDPWVWFGRNNLFPEYLRSLVDNCAPLERAISTLAQFVAGDGLVIYDKSGEEIEEAKAAFDTLMLDSTEEDFFFRTAYDMALGLGKSWTVRRGVGGDIVRLDHLDVSRLRLEKMTDRRIGAGYWSSDWCEYARRKSDERYTPERIAMHKWNSAGEALELIYGRAYKQNRDYYSEPTWMGAIQAAEVWTKVDNYNRTQLDTGFSPSVILASQFSGSPEEADKFDEDIEKAYTGSNGRGIFHTTYGIDEQPPQVTILQRGNHAGELDAMRDAAADVIYSAVGVPSLLLTDRKDGLTSQGEAVKSRLYQFQRTVVEPMQSIIEKDIVRILGEMGVTGVYEAKITPLNVQQFEQSEQIIMRSTTVNEAREDRGMEPLEGTDGDKLLAETTLYQAPDSAGAGGKGEKQVPKKGPKEVEPDEDEMTEE